MIEAVLLVVIAGGIARVLMPREKPSLIATAVAGVGGSLLGYLVGHEVLGLHDFHLFALESLLPAAGGSFLILAALRSSQRGGGRDRLFR